MSKEAELITELVLKNGMMIAVYGTRNEVHNKVMSGAVFAEFDCHSVMSSANRSVYSIRTDEVMMIGVERDPRKPATTMPLALEEFFSTRQPDGDIN